MLNVSISSFTMSIWLFIYLCASILLLPVIKSLSKGLVSIFSQAVAYEYARIFKAKISVGHHPMRVLHFKQKHVCATPKTSLFYGERCGAKNRRGHVFCGSGSVQATLCIYVPCACKTMRRMPKLAR